MSESRHAFSVLPAALTPHMAAEEEARGTQGFFFCSVGSRLQEAGRKMVIYTQFCIDRRALRLPILKVLQ